MDLDSLLMPPPPPRLPKRQKTAPPLDVRVGVVDASGEPKHPEVITIPQPPPPQSTDGNDRYGNGKRTVVVRSVSPKPESGITTKKNVGGSGGRSEDEKIISGGGGAVEESTSATQSHVGGGGSIVDGGGIEQSIHHNDNLATNDKSRDDCFGTDDNNNHDDTGNEISATTKSSTIQKIGPRKKNNTQSSSIRGCEESPPPVNVSFRDIIGHGQAKLRLDEALLPLALPPDLADSVLTGIRAAPASILLHGPPGCGKTKLAKAVAGEAQAAFLSVGPSDILSKFVGESEASIRGLFREARRKARKMESRCCVVFFDEIDALGRSRVGSNDDGESGKASHAGGDNSSRRLLAELLIQMTDLSNDNGECESDGEEDYDGYCDDGDSLAGRSTISSSSVLNRNDGIMQQPSADALGLPRPMSPTPSLQPKPRVIVVAATNRPEDCDAALLRRFAVRVLVGLPSRKDRKKIIRRLLSDVEHNVTPLQLDEISLATDGWSGSDLESMTREAVMAPVRECLRQAAILKRRASKAVQQRSGGADSSSQMTHEQKRAEDAQNAASREMLLNSFRNLRSVSSKDFEDGIAFFLGEQEEDNGLGFGFGNQSPARYDSSSSEDEE